MLSSTRAGQRSLAQSSILITATSPDNNATMVSHLALSRITPRWCAPAHHSARRNCNMSRACRWRGAALVTAATPRLASSQSSRCCRCAMSPPTAFVSIRLFSISERQVRAVQKSNRLRRDVERFQAKIAAVREAAASAAAAAAAPPAQPSPRPRSHAAQPPRPPRVSERGKPAAQQTQRTEQQEDDHLDDQQQQPDDAEDAQWAAAAAAGDEETGELSAQQHAERVQMRRVLAERIIAHQRRHQHPAVQEALRWSDAALLSDETPQPAPAAAAAAASAVHARAASRPASSPISSSSSSPPPSRPPSLSLATPSPADSFASFTTPPNPRALSISVVGPPNSGKSSLINRLVTQHISAVSPKRHTTRTALLGVRTRDEVQLELWDTPGMAGRKEGKGVEREMTEEALRTVSADGVDLLLVILDATQPVAGRTAAMLRSLQQLWQQSSRLEVALLLNKVDLVTPKTRLLQLTDDVVEQLPAVLDCFYLSVTADDGVQELEDWLFSRAVERDWDWDSSVVSEQSALERVEEVVREKLYQRLHKELPYSVQQRSLAWQEGKGGRQAGGDEGREWVRVEHELRVDSDGQRAIVVGSGGSALDWIRRESEADLQRILGRKVHLQITVRVGKKNDQHTMQ